MSVKVDKQMLKQPDAFITTGDKVLSWIEKHARSFWFVLGGALLASSAWVAFGVWSSHTEQAALESISKAESVLKTAQTQVRDERAKEMKDVTTGKDKKSLDQVRPADFDKDYRAAVDGVRQQIAQHAHTKAAMVSAVGLAAFLLENKREGEALDVVRIIKASPAKSDLLYGIWNMQLGLVQLENKQFDEALKAYQNVLMAPNLKAMHPEALVKLALVYDSKNDPAKARETLERVMREFPGSESASSAQQFMRALALKGQG